MLGKNHTCKNNNQQQQQQKSQIHNVVHKKEYYDQSPMHVKNDEMLHQSVTKCTEVIVLFEKTGFIQSFSAVEFHQLIFLFKTHASMAGRVPELRLAGIAAALCTAAAGVEAWR